MSRAPKASNKKVSDKTLLEASARDPLNKIVTYVANINNLRKKQKPLGLRELGLRELRKFSAGQRHVPCANPIYVSKKDISRGWSEGLCKCCGRFKIDHEAIFILERAIEHNKDGI